MAFPTDWGRKQKITIDNTKVGSTITDYPMLITLDHLDSEIVDAGANSALNGGGDVRFSSDSAGTTQLACEVVAFITNATAGTRRCEVWVKIPSVSSSVDTDFYIWYKKAAETQPSAGSTYGSEAVWSNYLFVSHNGGETDSSGNMTMTEYGTPTNATGIFNTANGARTWSGASTNEGYVETGLTDIQDLTMSAWVKPTGTVTSSINLISAMTNATFTNYVSMVKFDDGVYGGYSTSIAETLYGGASSSGTYAKLTQTLEETVGGKLYVNGSNTNSNASFDDSATNKTIFTIGYTGLGAQNWQGDISEPRLSSNIITAAWELTEYSNQNSPSTFATAGTPEAVGGTSTILLQITAQYFS